MNIVQQRLDELEAMRGRLAASQQEDGTWDWFLDSEIEQIKNARSANRTLRLRTLLKSLCVSIVCDESRKRKGAGA
ncbi:hypothetical protein D3C75_1104400 [compost metagenome]